MQLYSLKYSTVFFTTEPALSVISLRTEVGHPIRQNFNLCNITLSYREDNKTLNEITSEPSAQSTI